MTRIREPAQRIFAIEYNHSEHEDRGIEENAPNYIITPLGTRVNRAYISGVMMSKVNNGTEDSPMYRVDVRDPTGTYTVFAGQYQPQAIMTLSNLEPPALVGVVGKVRTFVRDDGRIYLSIKPESVFPMNIPLRDRWILSTVKLTQERIEAMKDAMEMEDPAVEPLMEKGHSRRAAALAVDGVGLYGRVELSDYEDGIRRALEVIIEGGGQPLEETSSPTSPEKEAKDGEDKESVKEKVLEIVKDLTGEKGALYRDIMAQCEEAGIDKMLLEETIQDLLDEGVIYEPTIGMIKTI